MQYFKYFFILLAISSYGQTSYTDTIYVGFTKTAYLIFDASTKIDFGSQDIIVRNPDNKVIIQAAVEGFDETNLLVQCNNEFFLYLVRYDPNPKKLFFNYQRSVRSTLITKNSNGIATEGKKEEVLDRSKEVVTERKDYAAIDNEAKEKAYKDSIATRYNTTCENMLKMKEHIFNRGSILGNVTFQITNIGILNEEFYFRMKITNNSKVSYDMDYIGWVVRDVKTKIKGQSRQDIQLTPKYIYNERSKINGKETVEVIYIFPKFVIGNDKKLNIEAWEDNGGMNDEGGRKMEFSLFNKELLTQIQQL